MLCVMLLQAAINPVAASAESSSGFAAWMPPARHFSNWSPASPVLMAAPAPLAIDKQTKFSVWRLELAARENLASRENLPRLITLTHRQHFYSRTQVSNNDETWALGSAGRAVAGAALWNLKTKQQAFWLPTAHQEAHGSQRQLLWDSQLNNVYWFTEGNALQRAVIDFAKKQTGLTTYEIFPDFEYVSFGHGEGGFSDDGRYILMAGKHKTRNGFFVQLYDTKARRKYPLRSLADDIHAVDWASIDPTGKWLVYASSKPEEIRAIPVNDEVAAKGHLLLDDIKHSDFVIDKRGTAWLAYGNWQGLFAIRIKDGYRKRIWPTLVEDVRQRELQCQEPKIPCHSMSGHVSRVRGRAGLVLVSRNEDGGFYFLNIDQPEYSSYAGNSYHGKAPAGVDSVQIKRLGVNQHGEVTSYYREPRGSASPTGRYIFFTSDFQAYRWGIGYDPEPENKALLHVIETGLEKP